MVMNFFAGSKHPTESPKTLEYYLIQTNDNRFKLMARTKNNDASIPMIFDDQTIPIKAYWPISLEQIKVKLNSDFYTLDEIIDKFERPFMPLIVDTLTHEKFAYNDERVKYYLIQKGPDEFKLCAETALEELEIHGDLATKIKTYWPITLGQIEKAKLDILFPDNELRGGVFTLTQLNEVFNFYASFSPDTTPMYEFGKSQLETEALILLRWRERLYNDLLGMAEIHSSIEKQAQLKRLISEELASIEKNLVSEIFVARVLWSLAIVSVIGFLGFLIYCAPLTVVIVVSAEFLVLMALCMYVNHYPEAKGFIFIDNFILDIGQWLNQSFKFAVLGKKTLYNREIEAKYNEIKDRLKNKSVLTENDNLMNDSSSQHSCEKYSGRVN